MINPPLPPREAERLATLHSLNLGDTVAEERFDRITRLAQRLFEVGDLLASQAQSKGLEFATFVHPAVPTQLRGDAGRLRQVLMNLASNAIKFTRQGGVVVQANLQSVTATEATILFSVSDTGIGIAPEEQKKLFQSFSQVDASVTREYGGTGLSLAISRRLVEMMGGEIGVNTVEGQGSRFWFTAHFDQQRQAVPAASSLRGDLMGLQLLVVDDNATSRRLVHGQANAWGMQVEAAASGEQALFVLRQAAAQGQPYHVAILDLQMPETDSITLGQQIKADSTLAQAQLIGMTCLDRGAQQVLAQGFSACLAKPVKPSRLLNCLVTVVSTLSAGGDHSGTDCGLPDRPSLSPSSTRPPHRHDTLQA